MSDNFELRLLAKQFLEGSKQYAAVMKHPASSHEIGLSSGVWIPRDQFSQASSVCEWVAAQSEEIEKQLEEVRKVAATGGMESIKRAIESIILACKESPSIPEQSISVKLTTRIPGQLDVETTVVVCVGNKEIGDI